MENPERRCACYGLRSVTASRLKRRVHLPLAAPPFLRELAVGLPEDLQAVCLACLAWDPADRPGASEMPNGAHRRGPGR